MLTNFKLAFRVLRRRKFFTFISLFGISLTLVVLMVLDFLFLGVIAKSFFVSEVGGMLGEIKLAPALLFYLLYVVGVVSGVLTIFFSVAYPSYLQSVVTKDELVEGNALLTGAEQVAHISGPALGGVLVQADRLPHLFGQQWCP